MDWYEEEVREIERAREKQAAPPCPVVFYGSSSIRLWSSLAEDLGDPGIVNSGFGGSTLEACAHYYGRLVAPLHPRSLVVYAGDNDLGNERTPNDVLASFRALIAQTGGVPFGFISIKISPARSNIADRIREANRSIQEEIGKHPEAYYVDVAAAMLDGGGKPNPELYVDDGLHLSRAGYEVWRRILRNFRNKIFTPDCGGVNAKTVSFSQENEPGVSQMV